jgi:hypothetical protein
MSFNYNKTSKGVSSYEYMNPLEHAAKNERRHADADVEAEECFFRIAAGR